MLRRSTLAVCILALVAGTLAGPALAQAPIAPTHTGETGLFGLVAGQNLPRGAWSFGLYYNNFDRVLEVGGREVDLDWHRLSASLGYGLTRRFELSVMAPYDSFDFDGDFGDDPDGFGQMRLAAKWLLAGGETGGTALDVFLLAPTGDEDLGADETGFGATLAWNNDRWFANLGYVDRGDPDELERQEEVRAGVGYALPIHDRFFWLTELVGTVFTGDGESFDDSLDLVTGARLYFGAGDAWAWNFALRTDLLQFDDVDEHCPIGGLIGLTYAPRLAAFAPPAPEPERAPPPPEPAPEPEPAPAPTPEPAPTPAAPEPPPPPPEERVTVPFDRGARVNNIAKARLDEVALRMKQDPELEALVIGYTDSTGSAEANRRVSEARAEAVRAYLVERHGIDPRRIDTEGRGPAEPVASNDTAAGRRQNRRAVIVLRVE